MSNKVLVVMSGGLDSTTLAYDLQSRDYYVEVVSFDYGQRHKRELQDAAWHAGVNGWRHDIIDISTMQSQLTSALTYGGDVPEGHYAADNMKATIVPNRNAIMLSLSCGIAVARGIPLIATAVHGGDHFIYPDCRPEFVSHLSLALEKGNEGFHGILAPYIMKDKNYIAKRAVELGRSYGYVWENTWSCYKGGSKHCGKCGTCVERMEALHSAGVTLSTLHYEDINYWREVITK